MFIYVEMARNESTSFCKLPISNGGHLLQNVL